ncbi:alkyl hydroperoxide reductase [Elizabethkingia meningoseptica]|uniref:alkyl hydroperoxide reductase n=1 Tax=Elizabethkingia meningoseptica TaxID=238 RepID=UPI0021A6005B|nr:alkyl hydroperoxide reductase [Elizabethkingia meningoseptica]
MNKSIGEWGNYMLVKIIILFILVTGFWLSAQTVDMYFPQFERRTYDFIIFKGSRAITLLQGTVPEGGRFRLQIPDGYSPYTGMSRWLLTNTKEGGGLDMLITGKDFSVSCTSDKPDQKNIIYTGNPEVKLTDSLLQKQEEILTRYQLMRQSVKVFGPQEKSYPVFRKEYQIQKDYYASFQQALKMRGDYVGQLIPIINIVRGTENGLCENISECAVGVKKYITQELDWQVLYTSGYWMSVIDIWVMIQINVVKNREEFVADFRKIENRIGNQELFADFSERVVYKLLQENENEYIDKIAPFAVLSEAFIKENTVN